MSHLYALPDHEVVESLIPGIGADRMSPDAAAALIRREPGLVPVAIDPVGGGQVYFADLGDYPYREWQFIYTVSHLAERGLIKRSFSTDLAVLERDDLISDPIEPSGFVFHISRCGSTLTGKALARLPEHIVVNQGGPLQRGFWAAMTRDWRQPLVADERMKRMLRNIVYLMTRPRRPEQTKSFVKFISWNTLYMEAIQAAFPHVPCLFLYRDPVEVIASVYKETTAILWAKARAPRQAAFLAGEAGSDAQAMDSTLFLAKCYANYFAQALKGTENLSVLNYLDLSKSTFPEVLSRAFRLRPDCGAVSQMLEQFAFHAKDDTDSTAFVDDSDAKHEALSQHAKDMIDRECGALLYQLDCAEHNLFAKRENTQAGVGR